MPTSRGASGLTTPGPPPTGRPCARSWPSGSTAGWRGSGSTWRTRWSRATRTARRRPRCGADLSGWLHETYPDAVLLPESDIEAPVDLGLRSGFDGDFFLVNQAAHSALFNNGGAGTLWWLPDHELCFFDADGPDGPGSLGRFLALWDEHIAGNGPDRRVILATADHDYSRLHTGDRGLEQLPAAYAFLLTWGTVPSIYYGDEIGMRYLPGLPDLEGSICYPGYNRAGCRTPMQWDNALPERRVLRRRPRPAVPAAGPRPEPPNRRRPARRPPLPAAHRPPADRPTRRPPRPRRRQRPTGAQPRLPIRLPARRHPPRRRQPPPQTRHRPDARTSRPNRRAARRNRSPGR